MKKDEVERKMEELEKGIEKKTGMIKEKIIINEVR